MWWQRNYASLSLSPSLTPPPPKTPLWSWLSTTYNHWRRMLDTLLLARASPAKSVDILPRQNQFLVRPKKNLMLTLFLNCKGPILEYFISRWTTIHSEAYCDLLDNLLKPLIRSAQFPMRCYSMITEGCLTQLVQQLYKWHLCICGSVLWVSSTPLILTKPLTVRILCIWTPKGGAWWQELQYGQWDQRMHRWLHPQSEDLYFFFEESRQY